MGARAGAGHTLRIERRLRASRERVFRAFTEAVELKQWYAPGEAEVIVAEVDLRVGGEYRIHMRGPDGTVYRLRGEYREVDSPAKLAFTWRWEHEPETAGTLVTVELEDAGGETTVRLTHAGFGSEADRAGHGEGWEGSLAKLAWLVVAGDEGRATGGG